MLTRSLKIILFLFCLPLYICGQNKLDSVHHIKEVVIVAKPFEEIIPTQKLTGANLARLNTHSVADALRYFAGVQIKDYGGVGGLKTVNIRSMGSQHLGVFYDGIQLGNAQNGIVDLGKFSLDDMDELALYNGQKSDIFISAKEFASANTIYLKSKKARFTSGKSTNLTLKYKAGSINLINPSFRLEHKLSDKVNTTLSTEYLKSDGAYKYRIKRLNADKTVAQDTTATRHNGDIESFRIENSFSGAIDNGYWETLAYFYSSHRGLPGAVVRNRFDYGQRLWDRNFFVQGSVIKNITERYKSSVKVKYAYDYTRYLDPEAIKPTDNTYQQQETYISWINLYKVEKNWEISLSADLQWNKLDANLDNFVYPERYSTIVAAATAYDFGKVKIQANILANSINDKAKVGKESKTKLTPTFIINYTPFDKHELSFRAFYKQMFRMPTFNDLYYVTSVPSTVAPENSTQYNVGATYMKDINNRIVNRFSVQADAYYIDIKDKIISSPKGNNNFDWMTQNLGNVEIKGLNLSANLSGKIDQVHWSTTLTYTYDKAQDFSDKNDSYYSHQIPYSPWHSGSLIVSSQYKGWGLNYSFIYVGERYDANQNNISVNYLQPWYTHDMSVQKEIKLKSYTIKASLEANNLLNQYYDVIKNYPMPGRNFKFILSIQI